MRGLPKETSENIESLRAYQNEKLHENMLGGHGTMETSGCNREKRSEISESTSFGAMDLKVDCSPKNELHQLT